ncbi:MAG: hypothetical protein ACE5FO_07605 [Parvularculaceae bacterium]
MTERLKQIWAGFEGKTERRLTGRGVDNIAVPHRRDWRAEDAQFLPENFEAPAAKAFEALKHRLAETEAAQSKKRRKRADYHVAPEPEATDTGFPALENLIRGLKATESRTERRDIDYVRFMSTNAGRELESLKKRKKFLGIF